MSTIEHLKIDRPLSIDNAMRFAVHLQTEGQLAHAEEILNRILQSNPTHAYALHLLGVIAHQVGKTQVAIQLIQKAVMSDGCVALFHSNLGEMYRQVNALNLSIECGQRAVKLDPCSAVALSNLGVAYYDAKNYEQAEICHKAALVLHPQQSNALNNLGSLHKERNNLTEAKRYYEAAIAASPNYVDPMNNLAAILLTEQWFQQAIELLNRAIALSPTFADAHCNLGFALNGLDNNDAALFHFQRALQFNPRYAEAYIGLSKVYNGKGALDTAANCVHKAIEINPNKAAFYQCLAEIYNEQGDPKQALSYFDRALSIEPTSGSILVSKANVLIELGESDEAEKLLSLAKTDASEATQLTAHYSLIQLRKVESYDDSMQALLCIAAHHMNTLAPSQQEYIHFSLGKCFDDMGEWSSAFEHFSKGCQLKRRRIVYSSEEQLQVAQRIMACFTEELVERLRMSSNPSALPIFVFGMPRSGTSLIEQVIASHPSVYGAGELHHLSNIAYRPIESIKGLLTYPDNIDYLSLIQCSAIADEYLACLKRHAPEAIRITDKMPANFMLIGLIYALFPNAKMIHVERNPIDTCLSCFTKLFRHGQHFSYDLIELGEFYTMYQSIMAHWRKILPADAWLDVSYERFVMDVASEARQLIEYCGLEWDPICLAFHTTKRQVRTASLTQVRQPIYTSSVERWRRFEHQLAPLIKILSF